MGRLWGTKGDNTGTLYLPLNVSGNLNSSEKSGPAPTLTTAANSSLTYHSRWPCSSWAWPGPTYLKAFILALLSARSLSSKVFRQVSVQVAHLRNSCPDFLMQTALLPKLALFPLLPFSLSPHLPFLSPVNHWQTLCTAFTKALAFRWTDVPS